MKKLLGVLLGCMVLCMTAYAQKDDPFMYRGELTAKDVIELMKKDEFLPLSVNVPRYFEDDVEKAEVVAVAVARVKKNDNYLNNYNAAVVYATADDLQGVDFGRHVNDEDSDKAVRICISCVLRLITNGRICSPLKVRNWSTKNMPSKPMRIWQKRTN